MPRPFTDDERARILQAVKAGKGRNEIAREHNRSPSSISKIAHAAGLNFDRSKTEVATKAKQADNRARRAELAPRFLDKAEEALDQIAGALARMSGPTLVYNFGGRDNTYEEHVLDSPPTEVLRAAAATVRDLMQTAKTASSAVLEMERVDQPQAGYGALEQLVEAIQRAREG